MDIVVTSLLNPSPEMHFVFRSIFMGLEKEYSKELATIRQQYPSTPAAITEDPIILHWHEAISLLAGAGHEVGGILIHSFNSYR